MNALRSVDVAIIGAGPAGLATAIGAAQRGLQVEVFDRQEGPADKACGEGLMPSGLRALERLGVRALLDDSDTGVFDSITYVQPGARAVGMLPSPGGLAVRRLELSRALNSRAQVLGIRVNGGVGVRSHERRDDRMLLSTDDEMISAGVLVAADGLHSASRTRAGLAGPVATLKRFGLRQHFSMKPWGRSVEVHFGDGVEAYVTPAGKNRVGLAFLWQDGAVSDGVSVASLLERFPELKERLSGAPPDSTPRGSGPLLQHVSRRVAPGFALVGDAAGYVDAITGEGLTQAFEGAEALAEALPAVLERKGAIEAFAPYEARSAAAFRRYARLAQLLVWTAQRPALRRVIISRLAASPWLFKQVLAQVSG